VKIALAQGELDVAQRIVSVKSVGDLLLVGTREPIALPFDDARVRIALMRSEEPKTEFDDAWKELLYDLGAHAQPMSDLGVQLTYRSVERTGRTARIEITDGNQSQLFVVDLSNLVYGLPDELAVEFLTTRAEDRQTDRDRLMIGGSGDLSSPM